ncbi:Uncharacterised protein [uncultured archaeon]|nr:Uncharacterised protein [uncultured archaeon]
MRKKITGILMVMLLFTTVLPLTVCAGDPENPEISDATGDARANVDLQKAWFFEDSTTPEYLYITIQVALLQPQYQGTSQNLVLWTMNNVKYLAFGGVGKYMGGVNGLYADVGRAGIFSQFTKINGSMDLTTNTITCKIPKSLIGNPHAGDALTKTYAGTSQRTPLMEKLGRDAYFITWFFQKLGKSSLGWMDQAPDSGYGKDYIIQY